MGVDACMHVTCNKALSSEDLLRFHRAISGAFIDLVWRGLDENELCVVPHRVYNEKTEEYDSPDPRTFDVRLMCRYYGEGYERGPAGEIIALGWFLEMLTEDLEGEVFYYGDSGGAEDEDIFDAPARKRLMRHFVKHQHKPYGQFFDSEKDGPECPLCKTQSTRYGWGASYRAWYCATCKRRWIERDGKLEITTEPDSW